MRKVKLPKKGREPMIEKDRFENIVMAFIMIVFAYGLASLGLDFIGWMR